MPPNTDRLIEELVTLLRRFVDRAFIEEHEQIKIEVIRLRQDLNAQIRFAEKLEEASENTGSIYLTDLKEKLKAREEGGDKWIRYVVATFVTLLFMTGSGLLGYLAAHPH